MRDSPFGVKLPDIMGGFREDAPVSLVLGPTNTGKTHLAVERMCAHTTGVIGLPLRLLAREVYDRIVKIKGPRAVALVTGEEKILPDQARYFVCTAEAMPRGRDFAFLALDEAQLAADSERGHVFTDHILHARGTQETVFLGAESLRPIARQLAPGAEGDPRERFSKLTYAGSKKLAKLPRRTAIVAFSAEQVYAIAELVRRQRGGAAVVMGSLSPRTRNAQVELYQSGEVDYLIATDAIGMGLNMDVDHVAFAGLTKFDGRRRRKLHAHEIGQIAGRAGRFRTDGTFGVTGDAPELSADVIARIENHQFEPLQTVQWRNADLRFSSLNALIGSLSAPAPDPLLQRVDRATDEAALRLLARDPDIAERADGRAAVRRLWEVCQIPDFCKVTLDRHVLLLGSIYDHLSAGDGRIPQDWMANRLKELNTTEGDVDALAHRLAHVRTWAYVANRADWIEDADHWRAEARAVEDALSDALHDRLVQRFIDRRTSALLRGLKARQDLIAAVDSQGQVLVEGHFVGRLDGLAFSIDHLGRGLEEKALRNAAEKALRPELNRRLGALVRAPDEAFALEITGRIAWEGRETAQLVPGPDALHPRVRLIGGELGASEMRARAERRIETWLARRIATDLKPLLDLEHAIEDGGLTGLARGIAYRLFEGFGAVARSDIRTEAQALSAQERRALKALGVAFGEYALYLPALVKPRAARLTALLYAFGPQDAGARPFLPGPGLTSAPVETPPGPWARYAAAGFFPAGPRAVRLDILDRLARLIRTQEADPATPKDRFSLTPSMTALLGCSHEDLAGVLRALGCRRAQRASPPPETAAETGCETATAPELWRRAPPRRAAKPPPTPAP
ncbi:MAG: helicase-related protein, partial [Maricaulaceae bacterium]